MTRATDGLLDELHGTVATTLLDEIRRYKNGEIKSKGYTDNEGNYVEGEPLPVPAALLAQAAKFLKDNGVDRAVRPGDTEDLLSNELTQFEQEDADAWHSRH